MSTIILDDCLFHLMEAQKCLDMYIDIDPFEEIFEATDPKTAVKLKTNAEAKSGALSHLKAAAQAVLNLIRNIISSIVDFFAKRFTSKKQREAYENFKAACAKDPSLKNKQITIMDFRKFNKEYESLLKEAEAADRALAEGKDYPADDLIKKISSFCGGAAKGVVVTVGCEAALQFASSSTDAAHQILNTLKSDEKMQAMLVDTIGKKETKRFEKQLAIFGKRTGLRRKIMQLKGYASTSFENAIENTLNQVEDLVSGATGIAKSTPGNDPSKNSISNTVATVKGVLTGDNFIDNAKKVLHGSNMVRRASGVDEIRQAVSSSMDISSKTSKAAREQYKDAKRAEREAKHPKKTKIQDQSMRDSFFGRNDPNSTPNRTKRFFSKRKK